MFEHIYRLPCLLCYVGGSYSGLKPFLHSQYFCFLFDFPLFFNNSMDLISDSDWTFTLVTRGIISNLLLLYYYYGSHKLVIILHLAASNELLWPKLQKCGTTIRFLEGLKIFLFREFEIDSNSSYATPENCFPQCALSLPREDDTSVCCILTGIQTPMIHQRFESVIPNRAWKYLP